MGLADRAPRGWHYQPSGLITVCMPYGMDTVYPYLGRLWVHGTMARTHARKGLSVRTIPLVRRTYACPLATAAACGSRGGRAGGRAGERASGRAEKKKNPQKQPPPSDRPTTAVPICQLGEQTRATITHRPASSHGQAPDGVAWNLEGRMYDDVGFLHKAAGPPCCVRR